MPPPVADDDHKRRARRRLIGAVALTIIAVIILPLVLEDEPPPAVPLELRMPPPVALDQKPLQNAVEYAPSPANTVAEPSEPKGVAPAVIPDRKGQVSKPAEAAKLAPSPAKSVQQQAKQEEAAQRSIVYTVQVGVFADKANVQKLQSRLSALGFKSYTDQMDGSTRVRLGSFSDKAEADAVSAKLAAAGIKEGQVVEK